MYRVGFTPWDGHPLAKSLHDLVEGNGSPALPAATALDIGCGTGDASIYLAQHGWQVTGVDFVPRALAKARAKAQTRQASINFVQADVTHLSSARGVGTGFTLIVDNGCLHNLTDKDRDPYVREVTAVAAPDALLLIGGLIPVSNLASAASLGPKSNAASLPRGRCCPPATHRKWPALARATTPSYSPASKPSAAGSRG